MFSSVLPLHSYLFQLPLIGFSLEPVLKGDLIAVPLISKVGGYISYDLSVYRQAPGGGLWERMHMHTPGSCWKCDWLGFRLQDGVF